jgi:hypothetical protein
MEPIGGDESYGVRATGLLIGRARHFFCRGSGRTTVAPRVPPHARPTHPSGSSATIQW